MPNSHKRKSKEEPKGASKLCYEWSERVEKDFFLSPSSCRSAPEYDPAWCRIAVEFWHHFSVGCCKSVFNVAAGHFTASHLKYIKRFCIDEIFVDLLKTLKLAFRLTNIAILCAPFVPRKPAAHFFWEFLLCARRVAKDLTYKKCNYQQKHCYRKVSSSTFKTHTALKIVSCSFVQLWLGSVTYTGTYAL